MLTMIIYLLGALRRALKKTGRCLFIVAEAFHEAMEDSRKAQRKYPFAD